MWYTEKYKVVVKVIGKRLRDLREKRGWTQTYTAKMLSVAHNTYNNYETGLRGVSEEMLVRIADLFNVSVDYLLGRVNLPDAVLTAVEKKLSDAVELSEDDFVKMNITIEGKPLSIEEKKLFHALIKAKRGL